MKELEAGVDRVLLESTGRKAYACMYAFGLSARSGENGILCGYDDEVEIDSGVDSEDEVDHILNNEEIIEIANHMIERWTEVRDKAQQPGGAR